MTDNEIPPELAALARRIQALREEARALGLFAEDRGLLSCPACGLLEDVTVEGRLITCDGNVAAGDDLGLRFVESPVGTFVCPRCGSPACCEDDPEAWGRAAPRGSGAECRRGSSVQSRDVRQIDASRRRLQEKRQVCDWIDE